MSDHLLSATFALALLVVADLGIWSQLCAFLSMRYELSEPTEIMMHAPYRLFWLPKVVVGAAQVILFIAASDYYRNGGDGLALGIAWIALLIIFGVLVLREGFRAFRRYEEEMRR